MTGKLAKLSRVLTVYVTSAYLIFQLLTRSDEHEILSHLPVSLHPSNHHPSNLVPGLRNDIHSAQAQSGYPYHIPHIPSPLPKNPDPASNTGIWRLILGILIYPFYLVLNILAILMPYVLEVGRTGLYVALVLLYPITSTLRLLGNTFLMAPLGVIRSVLSVFYPVYVFVGGVIGIGCVLGLGAAWTGQRVLDYLGYGKKKVITREGVPTSRSTKRRDTPNLDVGWRKGERGDRRAQGKVSRESKLP
jgi:hypothetical protein